MSWPSPQDYNEAVQTPALSFFDNDLQSATPECNRLGLPYCVTGAFASVYHMHDDGKDWAVRCFLHPLIDRTDRYGRISDFIMHDDLSYTVSFQFLEEGVRIHGTTYPLLKMDWVRGETFGAHVRKNLENKDVLSKLVADVKKMVERLQQAGVAHGDLQHDNIMVSGDELILVDYDGLFVPSLTGREASELGHRNYQHPFRTKVHFGKYLDNFSSWVISLSLKCLAIDPELWHSLKGGDDCLLMRQRDFTDPLNSTAFLTLESHQSEEIRRASRYIRSLLFLPVDELPPVEEVIPDSSVPDLPGLEYDRMWWTDYTGTTSSAPPAHRKTDPEPSSDPAADPASDALAVPQMKAVKPAGGSIAITYPEIKKDLAFKDVLWERSTPEIEVEIRFQLPADEPIVWTGGLDADRTLWDDAAGHAGSAWLNRMIMGLFFVFCSCPLFGVFSVVTFFMLLLVLLFYMILGRPIRHRWYALTDRRLIIVFQEARLAPNKAMRIFSMPLSEIKDINLSWENDSTTITTRRPISLVRGSPRESVSLYGFSMIDRVRFRDALVKLKLDSKISEI